MTKAIQPMVKQKLITTTFVEGRNIDDPISPTDATFPNGHGLLVSQLSTQRVKDPITSTCQPGKHSVTSIHRCSGKSSVTVTRIVLDMLVHGLRT